MAGVRSPRRRLARPLGWVGVVAILVGIVVAARGLWLPTIGGYLIASDPLGRADAIVPLGGGQERVVFAAELFGQGRADWLVTVDMPLNVPGVRESYAELVRREVVSRGVPAEQVLFSPGVVRTTYEEAKSLRSIAESRELTSLLLVTSPYHTRRSRIILSDVFAGSGISTAVAAVAPHWYHADDWWTTEDGLRETWTEYLKLGLYVLGYR